MLHDVGILDKLQKKETTLIKMSPPFQHGTHLLCHFISRRPVDTGVPELLVAVQLLNGCEHAPASLRVARVRV